MDIIEKHKHIYKKYFETFYDCYSKNNYYFAGVSYDVFKFYSRTSLPIAFEKLVDSLVLDIYEGYLRKVSLDQLLEMASYIHEREILLADIPYNMGYILEDGTYGIYEPLNDSLFSDFDSPEAIQISNNKTYLFYFTLSVMQFGQMLNILQKEDFEKVSIEKILNLQKSMERGRAYFYESKLSDKFTDYISPDKKADMLEAFKEARKADDSKRASKGGAARSKKLYSQTRKFVKKRYEQIIKVNPTIDMAQLAMKITKNLAEKPIEGAGLLRNPYTTIYEWVRKLNKGIDIDKDADTPEVSIPAQQ